MIYFKATGMILFFLLFAAIAADGQNRPLGELMGKTDPKADSAWESEIFGEMASKALQLINFEEIIGNTGEMPEIFRDTLAAVLRPDVKVVSDNLSIEVSRPLAALVADGMQSFEKAFRKAMEPFSAETGEIHRKFKIVRINGGETRIRFEISRGSLQAISIWLAQWEKNGEDLPTMKDVRLIDYEEVRLKKGRLITDVTEALLGDVPAFNEQLVYGSSHWNETLDVAFGVNQGNQGIAIADVNGDGFEDVYVCQPDGLPNRLFVRSEDGKVKEMSAEYGLDILDISRCALFVDLDNDGDQDFLLTHRSSLSVFENKGGGAFSKIATQNTQSSTSAVSAADYDNDGDLDIFLSGYRPVSQTSPEDIFANPVPYYDALNGAFNYLYRNEGGFVFSDATKNSGLDVKNTRFSFTSTWADYDGDGDMDLYVANDFGKNNLFKNQLVETGKPQFVDVASQLGVEDIGAGMSVDWGDPDNNGRLDLYVGNMWSSAGGRIAFQEQFQSDADAETRRMLQRHARGNSLFLQVGEGEFEDVSLQAGVEMGRWAWGSLFIDFDNDGWEDIYTTNGFMTAPDTGDL
jgi:hypothetical protein